MAEESVVTFVGGKAVEQTEALESNLETDEREAAKAAVRKAIQDAGDESAETAKTGKSRASGNRDLQESDDAPVPKKEAEPAERGPDGKFLPRDGTPKPAAKKAPDGADEVSEEPLDLDKASVKQLLKQRERVAAMKRDAKDEISKAQQEFQAQQNQFRQMQQQMAQERAQLKRERDSWQAIKTDPARAIREGGYDPEQFILDLAQEGTPEGQAKRQHREIQSQLAEIKAWREEQAQQLQQQRQYQQQQQAVQARHSAVSDFVKLGLNEEKYPHVANFYTGRERALVAEGDLTAEEYRTLSNGKEGSFEDILDYIEDQLATKAKAWYSKQGKGVQKVDTQQSQEKPKSKGKTLNPESSGERRTHTRNALLDLDGDERLEAAKQAVARAMAESRSRD